MIWLKNEDTLRARIALLLELKDWVRKVKQEATNKAEYHRISREYKLSHYYRGVQGGMNRLENLVDQMLRLEELELKKLEESG